MAGQRRNFAALSGNRLERPAMILAGNLPAIEPSIGKRDAAVRASIAHGESATFGGASQNQGDTQQHCGCHMFAENFRRAQRGIPVVIQQGDGGPSSRNLCASNFTSHELEFPYYSGRLALYEVWFRQSPIVRAKIRLISVANGVETEPARPHYASAPKNNQSPASRVCGK